ncbi:NUDIX hydrolase domain-like protein [Mycena vulgaris]|nr:NUDIX hydrolase domain-like protein [Mycena vulgaris]
MASSPYISTQYFAPQFVISAGCVLFRKAPKSESGEGADADALEICILHDRNKDEWLLPKGRKDCGESIAAAAVRETFEETGYACALLSCRMPTRAPRPGVNAVDAVAVVEDITEPIAVSVRERGAQGLKLVWWYIARATGAEKVAGTQTAWEAFDSAFVPADAAAGRLTFEEDRETVRKALAIVRDGNAGGI